MAAGFLVLAMTQGAFSRKYDISQYSDDLSGTRAVIQLRENPSAMKRLMKRLRMSQATLEQFFETDSSLRLDSRTIQGSGTERPMLYFIDPVMTSSSEGADEPYYTGQSAFSSISPEDVFSLHSHNGSSKSIYLDFTGHNLTDTGWNSENDTDIIAPPWDIDGDTTTFSVRERGIIAEVWRLASEDLASFDVDVTTEYRGNEDFLNRSNWSDDEYGVRILISPIADVICASMCGGIAYLDIFEEIGAGKPILSRCVALADQPKSWLGPCAGDFYRTAFVVPQQDTVAPEIIAAIVSHEVGHNFGLMHDGRNSSDEEYFAGHGQGTSEYHRWGPIMGTGERTRVSASARYCTCLS
jgi:hypothetical protein